MSKRAEAAFRDTGALLQGHFLLASGRHSPFYLEKFLILQHPKPTERLCAMIARHFRDAAVSVVVGPTLGGVIIAHEVARKLGARAVYAEREGDRRAIRRSLSIAPGERVLVVDDIMTTGGSIREVIDEVERWGGTLVGVGILADRTLEPVDFGAPFYACCRLTFPTYAAAACPQCAAGAPLVKPGGS